MAADEGRKNVINGHTKPVHEPYKGIQRETALSAFDSTHIGVRYVDILCKSGLREVQAVAFFADSLSQFLIVHGIVPPFLLFILHGAGGTKNSLIGAFMLTKGS